MAFKLDREALIGRLQQIAYTAEANEEQAYLEQMSLAGVLLTLAEIDHEREYSLCRTTALHLLGTLYEPEDIMLD
jgi:hypothetical protein